MPTLNKTYLVIVLHCPRTNLEGPFPEAECVQMYIQWVSLLLNQFECFEADKEVTSLRSSTRDDK